MVRNIRSLPHSRLTREGEREAVDTVGNTIVRKLPISNKTTAKSKQLTMKNLLNKRVITKEDPKKVIVENSNSIINKITIRRRITSKNQGEAVREGIRLKMSMNMSKSTTLNTLNIKLLMAKKEAAGRMTNTIKSKMKKHI
jgi:hypothetical protein